MADISDIVRRVRKSRETIRNLRESAEAVWVLYTPSNDFDSAARDRLGKAIQEYDAWQKKLDGEVRQEVKGARDSRPSSVDKRKERTARPSGG